MGTSGLNIHTPTPLKHTQGVGENNFNKKKKDECIEGISKIGFLKSVIYRKVTGLGGAEPPVITGESGFRD